MSKIVKSKIIFYGMKVEAEGLAGTFLHKPEYQSVDTNRIIGLFNERKIKILLVPIWMSTGWKTKLTGKECIVLFTNRFSEESTIQAMNRLSYEPCIQEEKDKQQVCIGTPEGSKTQ